MDPRISKTPAFSFLSTFSKYIAPSYCHDRAERSAQMRLYSLKKGDFGLLFTALFGLLGVALFIGLAGPAVTVVTEVKVNEEEPHIPAGPFTFQIPAVTSYNQEFWILAEITTGNKDDETYEKKFHINVCAFNVLDRQAQDEQHDWFVRDRLLSCNKQKCSDVYVYHGKHIQGAVYLMNITFDGLEHIHMRYTIEKIAFRVVTYNGDFSTIELWMRLLFVFATLVVSGFYFHNVRKYPFGVLTIEQRWTYIHLPLLLLYNNPLLTVKYLSSSSFWPFLDSVFQATFLCGLLLFWLCIYHGLRQSERSFLIFYLPKIVVVGSLWLLAIIVETTQNERESADPTYSYMLDSTHLLGLKVTFCVCAAAYLVYLAVLLVKAYLELGMMNVFDIRLKFITFLMLLVLTATITITITRFDLTLAQDQFAVEWAVGHSSSLEFIGYYSLLNFYVFSMALVYAPPPSGCEQDSHLLKDEAASSLLNESDEDILYGPDAALRRTLTQGQDDDSD